MFVWCWLTSIFVPIQIQLKIDSSQSSKLSYVQYSIFFLTSQFSWNSSIILAYQVCSFCFAEQEIGTSHVSCSTKHSWVLMVQKGKVLKKHCRRRREWWLKHFPILQFFSSTSKIAIIIFQDTILLICLLEMFSIWAGRFFFPQFAKWLNKSGPE